MSNQEINNSLVLLRKYAEQSRVHIVRKLTREAHKYRKKKGTETQKAKNNRKSKKLIAEILAVKKVKKDEITKFALKNTHTLKEILENQKTKPYTRILTRISHHKIFNEKINDFKLKYPNYMDFLESKKKRKENRKQKKLDENSNNESSATKTKLQDQEICETSNSEIDKESDNDNKTLIDSDIECTEINNTNVNDDISLNSSQSEDEQISENSSETDIAHSSEQKNIKTNSIIHSDTKLFTKSVNKKNKVEIDQAEKNKNDRKSKTEKNVLNTSKIINKQTIVKRFTDVLQDETCQFNNLSEIRQEPIESNIEYEKEVDPFFVTEDGEANYLSVALPKNNLTDENDLDDIESNKFNHSRLSLKQNVKKRAKFDKKDTNYNSNRSNSKWKEQAKNAKPFRKTDKSLSNFKKFNESHNDKSTSYKKQNGNRNEDKANEILHPSWEAKRKQQQILQQGFQGKKIVFGD